MKLCLSEDIQNYTGASLFKSKFRNIYVIISDLDLDHVVHAWRKMFLFDLIKCLKQIFTCSPISEVKSNISIMIGLFFCSICILSYFQYIKLLQYMIQKIKPYRRYTERGAYREFSPGGGIKSCYIHLIPIKRCIPKDGTVLFSDIPHKRVKIALYWRNLLILYLFRVSLPPSVRHCLYRFSPLVKLKICCSFWFLPR